MRLDTLIKLFLELEGADPDTLRPDLPHPLGTSVNGTYVTEGTRTPPRFKPQSTDLTLCSDLTPDRVHGQVARSPAHSSLFQTTDRTTNRVH